MMFFSAPQAIYDSWFVTLYNVVFTSLPVIGLAILEQVKFPALLIFALLFCM